MPGCLATQCGTSGAAAALNNASVKGRLYGIALRFKSRSVFLWTDVPRQQRLLHTLPYASTGDQDDGGNHIDCCRIGGKRRCLAIREPKMMGTGTGHDPTPVNLCCVAGCMITPKGEYYAIDMCHVPRIFFKSTESFRFQ